MKQQVAKGSSMEVHKKQQSHFILVHGACHGAWCWYKVKPQLEAAGHRVTALDLSASGINRKEIHEIHSMKEYSQPLMDILASIPPNEKVILVGHSLGGLSLALAMDEFPEKVSVGVFLAAFMPDTVHQPSYVLDQYTGKMTNAWLDTQFLTCGSLEKPVTSMLFGPNFMSVKVYQLSPIEDLELAFALARPSSLFLEDLSKAKKGYDSVAKVYLICEEDETISEEFQKWMIENYGAVKEVMAVQGADHMPMFSKPRELCTSLSNVAHNYGT